MIIFYLFNIITRRLQRESVNKNYLLFQFCYVLLLF